MTRVMTQRLETATAIVTEVTQQLVTSVTDLEQQIAAATELVARALIDREARWGADCLAIRRLQGESEHLYHCSRADVDVVVMGREYDAHRAKWQERAAALSLAARVLAWVESPL